jgi:hypothetical protein
MENGDTKDERGIKCYCEFFEEICKKTHYWNTISVPVLHFCLPECVIIIIIKRNRQYLVLGGVG